MSERINFLSGTVPTWYFRPGTPPRDSRNDRHDR